MNKLAHTKLLYVEDDATTRDALTGYLKKYVGKVLTAADGEQGLKKFEEERPDIVIADLLMPKMNGMDMLARIREIDRNCAFIITSTVEEAKTVTNAVDFGIVKYIIKPIVLSDLNDALSKVAGELVEHSDPKITERRKMEGDIKKSVTLMIKENAGKGPRDVSVFIYENSVEIVVYDAFTQVEQFLLKDKRNESLIEQFRRSFYSQSKNEIEGLVESVTGFGATLTTITLDLQRGFEKLELAY